MLRILAITALTTILASVAWAEESLSWDEAIERLDRQPVAVGTAMPDMTAVLQAGDQQQAGSVIDRLLSSGSPVDTSIADESTLVPLVFVSFSMPDAALSRLLVDAHKVGAQLVLNGLVDDDLKKTAEKIATFTDKDKSNVAGFSIDPTLFERFAIKQVPVFVLPLASIPACTQDAGCPTPPHIRISGDVSLDYALEKLSSETDHSVKDKLMAWVHTLRGDAP